MSRAMHYLAYGSNLSTPRLRARVPSARALTAVELPGWELRFHKRGVDGSGKCSLMPAPGKAATAHGVVWEIAADEKAALDAVEGRGGGYRVHELAVVATGRRFGVFTYVAAASHVDESLAPFGWYLDFVLAGAREHRLPASYRRWLERTPTRPDPDRRRAARNRRLL